MMERDIAKPTLKFDMLDTVKRQISLESTPDKNLSN